jgi:hypothetical protein
MKHRVDQILDDDSWETESWEDEIKIRIEQGFDLDDARAATVIRYMRNGDLRPFQAYIDKALCTDDRMIALDRTIVDCLAECITLGLLVPKPGRKHKKSAKFSWDHNAKLLYDRERAAGLSHDKAIKKVARQLKRPKSTESVRKAVTRMRKPSEK